MKTTIFLSIAVLLVASAAATAATRRVPDEYPTIQAAIDVAVDGDVVIVAPGTYTGPGNRDIDFLGKVIILRSTDPNDPNIVAATIIDCNGTKDEPHRGFYFHSSEGPYSILAGITITNGYGPYKEISTYMRSVGGAIYLEGSSPTIRNCFITGNSAYWYGGAIYCISSNPQIKECVISNNFSENNSGGAISCYANSSPSIIDCTITGNSAGRSGGGINIHSSSPQIFNCSITGNSATNGGGIACFKGSPVISRCKIIDNSATFSAGGINCSFFSSVSIDNCIITGNIAQSGGGIRVWQGSADIIHCTVANNSAERGGGIDCGASRSTVTMSHCILWNNIANSGAQVMLRNSSEPSHFAISYSDVQGGQANVSVEPGWILNWDKSNIDADPCFINLAVSNYHLAVHSPCIDAGDPAYGPEPGETDIDGEPRLMGVRVDMGADESTFITETPVIGFAPARFNLSSYKGGPNPEPQILFIRNTGISMLDWKVTADCLWLEPNPTNGESTDEIGEVTLSIDISGLEPGLYICDLQITANEALNSPQMVAVTLYIGDGELHVPSEYPTIQAAIGDAVEGEVVIVANGTYTGEGNRDINFKGKAITVRSENGPKNCIIDCEGTDPYAYPYEPHSGFIFKLGEDHNSVLDGFTITNGNDSGIVCGTSSSPSITNCIISGNSTTAYSAGGGGISCFENSSPIIVSCIIKNNSVFSWGWIRGGGGIYCEVGSLTISNCVIQSNSVSGNEGEVSGGGIFSRNSSVVIKNCIIADNTCFGEEYGDWNGGGIFCSKCDATIINSTIASNSAGNNGGGIYCKGGSLAITNCTISGNTAPSGAQIYSVSSTPTVTYSDIQDGWEGEGNIDADPCFVEPGYWDTNNTPDDANDDFWVDGDYHLLSDSPCIDSGDNNSVPADIHDLDGDGNTAEPLPFDLDGNPRFVDRPDIEDTGNGTPPIVDMGAYEAIVSCFGVNHVKLGTKAGKKGNKVEVKGTFDPASPIDFAVDDVTYIIDDGLGYMLTFIIPAGSFEPEGKPDKQKFRFHSPKGSQPDIKARFDFLKCKFELKVKGVMDTSEITADSLAIVLQAGENPANLVEEVVQVQAKPKHLEFKREPELNCLPEM